jgi:hypothetical protein
VTSKYLGRVAMIGVLSVALSTNAAAADQLQKDVNRGIVLVIVGVAVVLVVAVVVIHESRKKRTITGCVNSAETGLSVTDEKDKRVYALSGDTAGVKPSERVSLQGTAIKPNAGKPLAWETKKIIKDFGTCQP